MRLLYVSSAHPTLEYNDLSLFTGLGIECFSTGIYVNPSTPLRAFRGWNDAGIQNMQANQDLVDLFVRDNPNYHASLVGYNRPRLNLTREFVDNFDVVMCNSFSHYVFGNWSNIKHKPVIWRTYGDQRESEEVYAKTACKGLIRVRSWENELRIPNSDSGYVIHCHVDDDWFNGWNGTEKKVLSFQNAFHVRKQEASGLGYMELRRVSSHPFELYGDFPEADPLVQGQITRQQQLKKYQDCRVYFSIGSHPAAMTYNFMEAYMTGIPVVTFGYEKGAAMKGSKQHLYQVPAFIDNLVDGIYADSIMELSSYIDQLMIHDDIARKMSVNAQTKARNLWSKEVIGSKWVKFFNRIGVSV